MKALENQMTLGALIEAFEPLPDGLQVLFDFCNFVPTKIESYRGYYEDLALGHKPLDDAEQPSVATVRALLKAAVGAHFAGYKGGEYTGFWETALWVDNPGKDSSTAIVGVVNAGYVVIIKTETAADRC